jgi:hypothetical protein
MMYQRKALLVVMFSGLLVILSPWLHAQPEKPRIYKPGEKLEYNINFSFLSAGNAYLTVEEDTFQGKKVWHIKLLGRTTGLADVIYRVRDRYECYMDPATGFPLMAIRDIHEGNYKRYNEVTFDHYSREDSSIVHSMKKGEIVVPKNIYDVLTGFYYFRNHYAGYRFKDREAVVIQTYFTDELFPLKIRYLGRETVNIGKQKVRCLRFGPVTEKGRAFASENDMAMWLTDDGNFFPVKVLITLKVGSFKINLEDYEGLKFPFSAKIEKR